MHKAWLSTDPITQDQLRQSAPGSGLIDEGQWALEDLEKWEKFSLVQPEAGVTGHRGQELKRDLGRWLWTCVHASPHPLLPLLSHCLVV